MDRDAEAMLRRIESLYDSMETSEKGFLGIGTKKKTVQGLEGIVNSELFSDRLWVTNTRLHRRGRVAPPSRKATVMIIGNHSAGKSSFINWYCDTDIQSTGIALETSNFTMITHGSAQKNVGPGFATFLYPMFKELLQEGNTEVFPGFLGNLEIKVATSKAHHFPFVDFIDTPGLTDGLLTYQCDMNVITWLAGYVDFVFVFFDPIGQALCKKTLDFVKEIHQCYPHKIKFCLTKIDEIRKPTEFNKLISQISLSLSQILGGQINSLDIYPICLPDRQYQPDKTQNRIEELSDAISAAVDSKAQQNLSRLHTDLQFIDSHLSFLEREDRVRRKRKLQLTLVRWAIVGLIIAMAARFSDAVMDVEPQWKVYIGAILFVALVASYYLDVHAYSKHDRQQIAEWRQMTQAARAAHKEMEAEFVKSIRPNP